MSHAEPVARESELMGQLIDLLAEEQQWLAREPSAAVSPFNERRAELLAELEDAARERAAGGPQPESGLAELGRRAKRLNAANERNTAMVRERLRGLERALKHFGRDSDYGEVALEGTRLGRG